MQHFTNTITRMYTRSAQLLKWQCYHHLPYYVIFSPLKKYPKKKQKKSEEEHPHLESISGESYGKKVTTQGRGGGTGLECTSGVHLWQATGHKQKAWDVRPQYIPGSRALAPPEWQPAERQGTGVGQGSGDFEAQPAKIHPFTISSIGFSRFWPGAKLLPFIWTVQYPILFFSSAG